MTAPAGATTSVPAEPVAPATPAVPVAPATPLAFQVIFFSLFLHFFLAEMTRSAPACLPFLTMQAVIGPLAESVAASAVPPTTAARQIVATTFGYVSLSRIVRT